MALDTVPLVDEVTLTKSGTGYSDSEALAKLGDTGELYLVQCRLDSTLDEASACTIIISTDSTIDANTPDENIVYESDPQTPGAGSDTVAFLIENLKATGTALYKGNLYIAVNVTAAGGAGASTSIEAKVTSRVTP